jgi:Cellulose binding domain
MRGFLQAMMRDNLRKFLTITMILTLLAAVAIGIGRRDVHAATYCNVTYTISNQWTGGFSVQNLAIQNTSSSAWANWTLTFTFPAAGQAVSNGWNGAFAQLGQQVTVTSMNYNGAVAANASVNPAPGFNGTYTSSNPVPTSFSVNGNVCGASVSPTSTSTAPTATPTQGTGTATPTSTPNPGNKYISANQVLWIGDSWVVIPGNQHTQARDLARTAGVIGPNDDFTIDAVSGSPISAIVNQYNTQEASSVKPKLIVMDGGGIDLIGNVNQTTLNNVVNTFKQFLTKVKSDGTVKYIIYYLYPEIPATPGVADALRPVMTQACSASAVPCYFLDLQPVIGGLPTYLGSDNIHPTAQAATLMGNAIWNIIQTNNLMKQ